MKKLFWVCLSLITLGLLARINLNGTGLLILDILLPIISFIWIGKKIVYRQKLLNAFWAKIPFLFLLVLIISWLIGAWDLDLKEKIISASYLVRIFNFLIFGLIAGELFKNKEDEFFAGFLGMAGIIIISGFLQFFLIPDISIFSREGGWDPHIGRLLGTWMDPNYLAGFIGFLLPISIAKWYENVSTTNLWQKDKKLPKSFLSLFILTSLVALFLTFSRSGYLAAGTGLLVFFFFRDWKIILISVFIAIIGIMSSQRAQARISQLGDTFSSILFNDTSEIDATAKLRIQNWIKSYSLFEKNKITGIGYNTYRYTAAEEGIVDENYFSAGGADSTHLTILVTSGIVGFVFYLLFLGNFLIRSLYEFHRSKKEIFLGFFAGFSALIIHSFFVNSLFFPLIFICVMAVWGVIYQRRLKV